LLLNAIEFSTDNGGDDMEAIKNVIDKIYSFDFSKASLLDGYEIISEEFTNAFSYRDIEKGYSIIPFGYTKGLFYKASEEAIFNSPKYLPEIVDFNVALSGLKKGHFYRITITGRNSRKYSMFSDDVTDDRTLIIKNAYKEIMEYVDICFGNSFDLTNFMDISDNSIKTFLKQYNVKYLIHTTRNIIDANTQELSGNLYSADLELHTEAKRFEVLDRIGGGDAFVAGIIHVLNKDINNLNDALSLGIDLGILKHLVSGDVLGLSGREINKWLNNSKKDVIR
jgi:hypothetical protein